VLHNSPCYKGPRGSRLCTRNISTASEKTARLAWPNSMLSTNWNCCPKNSDCLTQGAETSRSPLHVSYAYAVSLTVLCFKCLFDVLTGTEGISRMSAGRHLPTLESNATTELYCIQRLAYFYSDDWLKQCSYPTNISGNLLYGRGLAQLPHVSSPNLLFASILFPPKKQHFKQLSLYDYDMQRT